MRANKSPVALLLLAVILVVGYVPAVGAGSQMWTKTLDQKIAWHRVTMLGTLLVATDDALICMDAASGEVIWKRDDLVAVADYNVKEVPGTPFLLVGENKGKIKPKTTLYALTITDGATVWKTEEVAGYSVRVVPIPHKSDVILVTIPVVMNVSKLDLTSFDIATGKQNWVGQFPKKVELHMAEASGALFQRFDLSGYSPPVYDGDAMFVEYEGLYRFNLETGAIDWNLAYDVTPGTIKRANAQAIVDEKMIYTSAKGQLRGIDKATGEEKWKSKDFGGALAEMALVGDVIYGRLGGHFYDRGPKEWVLKKPMGVVAVNRKTGEQLWRYDDAKASITNMAVFPDHNIILIADEKNLIGLDMNSEGKVKEAYKIKLEFKNKIGAGDAAIQVMSGIMGGGRGKKGGSNRDTPVNISTRADGTVTVRGKQHLLQFDPKKQEIVWSAEYAAPGVPGWQKAIMGVLAAMSFAEASARSGGMGLLNSDARWSNRQNFAQIDRYHAVASKRFTATESTDRYAYILTSVEGEQGKKKKKKTPGIVGVNLDSGEVDREIPLNDKEPDYEVDEIAGRVFSVKDEKILSAFSVD